MFWKSQWNTKVFVTSPRLSEYAKKEERNIPLKEVSSPLALRGSALKHVSDVKANCTPQLPRKNPTCWQPASCTKIFFTTLELTKPHDSSVLPVWWGVLRPWQAPHRPSGSRRRHKRRRVDRHWGKSTQPETAIGERLTRLWEDWRVI